MAFMAMNVVVEDERILDQYRKMPMKNVGDSYTDVSILCDSGTNFRIIPLKDDLGNTRTFNGSCRFGNEGQLQALAMGEMS